MPAGLREKSKGVAVTFEQVSVLAAGRAILQDVNLTIEPGEHVAIVGRSGAGKSSLVGALLGWHQASSGQILVDDVRLQGKALAAFRRQTAWIDPAVHLWNRSLFENLRYGAGGGPTASFGRVVETAELDAIRRETWDHNNLGNAIPGATPSARIDVRTMEVEIRGVEMVRQRHVEWHRIRVRRQIVDEADAQHVAGTHA